MVQGSDSSRESEIDVTIEIGKMDWTAKRQGTSFPGD
jgi:hypothetical protein